MKQNGREDFSNFAVLNLGDIPDATMIPADPKASAANCEACKYDSRNLKTVQEESAEIIRPKDHLPGSEVTVSSTAVCTCGQRGSPPKPNRLTNRQYFSSRKMSRQNSQTRLSFGNPAQPTSGAPIQQQQEIQGLKDTQEEIKKQLTDMHNLFLTKFGSDSSQPVSRANATAPMTQVQSKDTFEQTPISEMHQVPQNMQNALNRTGTTSQLSSLHDQRPASSDLLSQLMTQIQTIQNQITSLQTQVSTKSRSPPSQSQLKKSEVQAVYKQKSKRFIIKKKATAVSSKTAPDPTFIIERKSSAAQGMQDLPMEGLQQRSRLLNSLAVSMNGPLSAASTPQIKKLKKPRMFNQDFKDWKNSVAPKTPKKQTTSPMTPRAFIPDENIELKEISDNLSSQAFFRQGQASAIRVHNMKAKNHMKVSSSLPALPKSTLPMPKKDPSFQMSLPGKARGGEGKGSSKIISDFLTRQQTHILRNQSIDKTLNSIHREPLFAEKFVRWKVRPMQHKTTLTIKHQDYRAEKVKRERQISYWQNKVVPSHLPPIDLRKRQEVEWMKQSTKQIKYESRNYPGSASNFKRVSLDELVPSGPLNLKIIPSRKEEEKHDSF